MLTHTDLRKGARIIVDGAPYEVLEAMPLKKAQRRVVIQTRIKNLLNNTVSERNFHQADVFEEAELGKFDVKFIYAAKGRYFFCEKNDPSKRFDLSGEQIGATAKFLKQNAILQAIVFDEKIISVSMPVKIELRVADGPPGVKGDSAQAGTKVVTLETGADIDVPLFIAQDDIIEVNTETEEYVRRIE